jgi:hypothetical protein
VLETTTTVPETTTTTIPDEVSTTTTIPDEVPPPDLVHGCIGQSGLLRVVPDLAQCRVNETPVSWLAWLGGLELNP